MNNAKIKNITIIIGNILFAYFMKIKTFADNDLTVTINKGANSEYSYGNGSDAANQLKEILTNDNNNGLMDITSMAGSLILAFGIGQMILAFKDDNPDSKSRASMVLMGGVFLIVIPKILTSLGAL